MIKLTINDQPVEVESGATVLEAAQKAGVLIPTLCHHPRLTPYGACRLCLVQVEGAKKLQPSCTLAATDGMVVQTETKGVKDARKFVLSMLFSERNHFCMYCQSTDGDCDLQQAAYHQEMTHWPITPGYLPFAVDASHPDFVLDNNRCILCRRCLRACSELVGNATLGFEERGSASILVADDGVPLGDSTCISCGNCVQICPTGALIDRKSIYLGRKTDFQHNHSVCIECSMGCSRDVQTRDNRLVRLDGLDDGHFNEGLLCEFGRYSPLKESRTRLTAPLIRRNGTLEPTTWEEALHVVSTQLKAHDSDEITASISARQSIESLSAFYEFFHDNFQIESVTTLVSDKTAQTSLALAETLGESFESDLAVLKDCDVAIVLGADMINDHQVAGFMLKRQALNGLQFIIGTTQATSLADFAGTRLQYVGENLNGLVELFNTCLPDGDQTKREYLAEKLGLKAEMVSTLAEGMVSWKKPVVIVGRDFALPENLEEYSSLISFARAIHAPVVSLKGKANSLAAALIGYQTGKGDPDAKVAFLSLGDGKYCESMLGRIKDFDFTIVHAAYQSELTGQADVVLPAKLWTEEEGHFLSSDGKLRHNPLIIQAFDDGRSVSEIMTPLAKKMGFDLSGNWKNKLAGQSPINLQLTEEVAA